MEDKAKDLMSQGMPWRRDARWPVIAVEAAVLLGIGAYLVIDNEGAGDVVLQLIGVVLLGMSLMLAAAGLRAAPSGLGFYDAFRAGIGVTTGAVATVSWWSDYIENPAVRVILGWGLVAYSLLHVVGLIVVRGRAGLQLSGMVIAALTLVLGIVLLTGDEATSPGRINVLGIVMLVFGALLAVFAYYLFSRKDDSGVAGASGADAVAAP